ncbi:MAG: hypothetical protein ACHQ6T_16195 [Myxococcota bacterium]
MIRELRRRHRLTAVGLALLLPPAYVVALASRAPVPLVARPLPAALGEPLLALTSGRVRLPAQSVALALGRAADGSRVVELDTRGLPALPDALVYWSARDSVAGSLPDDSFFLGAVPGNAVRAYRLPAASDSGAGSLVVFSVAWQKIVLAQSLVRGAQP